MRVRAANGAEIHQVAVRAGRLNGRIVTFTQHSPDRYTVFGFSAFPEVGLSIERRTHEEEVLTHSTGAVYTLGASDQWIAHSYVSGGYYGVHAVGATPQEAYEKAMRDFS